MATFTLRRLFFSSLHSDDYFFFYSSRWLYPLKLDDTDVVEPAVLPLTDAIVQAHLHAVALLEGKLLNHTAVQRCYQCVRVDNILLCLQHHVTTLLSLSVTLADSFYYW